MVEPLFFFGAGASRPFDVPTMKEMVNDFRSELDNIRDNREELRLYDLIDDSLKDEARTPDLESIFTVVDAIALGKTLKDTGHLSMFLAKQRASRDVLQPFSSETIATATTLKTRFENYVKRVRRVNPSKKLDRIMEIYLPFLNAVYSSSNGTRSDFVWRGTNYRYNQFWNFFTTNYDNVIELLWRGSTSPVDINTGFRYNSASKSDIWDAQKINEENLRLLKLHGSVNWWRREDTGTIVERDQPPNEEFVPGKFGEQLMLYPIQQKDVFVPPYFDLFYAFRRALEQTRQWIVIGYSFADDIIRGMFARTSIAQTKMILVHPDPTVANLIGSEPGWKGRVISIHSKFGQPETNNEIEKALRAA